MVRISREISLGSVLQLLGLVGAVILFAVRLSVNSELATSQYKDLKQEVSKLSDKVDSTNKATNDRIDRHLEAKK